MSAGSRFEDRMEQAIAALLTEPSHALAAVKAGISEATLQRWLLDPAFRDAYRQARRAVLETAIGHLQQATGEAVAALKRNLTCGSPPAEIRSAVAIFELSLRGLDSLDLAAELDTLKQQIGAKRHGNGKHDGARGETPEDVSAPADAGGPEPAGGNPPRPDAHPDGRGHGPGPVAETGTPLF
jgi:hypothetical protein